jgi:16S rRNA (adenine1518-N6/adenine1519-N6)-dimethyltransferase
MSLLSLSVQVYGTAEIVARIPSQAFFPAPKVDSAVVRIEAYGTPLIPPPLVPVFFRLARAGFMQRRKTLRNALAAGLNLSPTDAAGLLTAADIDPRRRAETLGLAEWGLLSREAAGRLA